MTTPIVPDFILLLFQNEINNITTKVLEKVCTLYKLDIEEVKKRLKEEAKVDLAITRNEKIKVVKTQAELAPVERCIARVFNRQELCLMQCTRRHGKDYPCCKKHQSMMDKGNLKHGTINEQIPTSFVERMAKMKITKVY